LKDLKVEIGKIPNPARSPIPNDQKEAYVQAKTKCLKLLTPEFYLKFLRCEVFNADVSNRCSESLCCLFVFPDLMLKALLEIPYELSSPTSWELSIAC
jgi:hypothetical protein